VQAELDGVLGAGTKRRLPSPDDMGSLPVLRACVDETLRMFPAAPLTNRVALQDDVIDGYNIPAGTVRSLLSLRDGVSRFAFLERFPSCSLRVFTECAAAAQDIFICPGVLHRLPSLWTNPGVFSLDRWLPKPEGAAAGAGEGLAVGSFTYMPFLVGPHGCIGRRFAHLEACTTLAVILQRFSFAPVAGREVRATLRVTQRPNPSLQLMVTPR